MDTVLAETSAVIGIGLARIGVPLGLTLIAVQLSKRRQIHQWADTLAGVAADAARQGPATESALDVLRHPCWEARGCTETARQKCAACHHPTIPCWAALWIKSSRLPAGCGQCARFGQTRALRQLLQ
jgi:hypothetical protein